MASPLAKLFHSYPSYPVTKTVLLCLEIGPKAGIAFKTGVLLPLIVYMRHLVEGRKDVL